MRQHIYIFPSIHRFHQHEICLYIPDIQYFGGSTVIINLLIYMCSHCVDSALTDSKIICKADSSSGSIGRRYARADEIGIPYAITVDYDTLTDDESPTVTLRERDSMEQIRIPVAQVTDYIRHLSTGHLTWSALKQNQLPNSIASAPESDLMPKLDFLINSSFFFDQSFAIYGSHIGQHDFGPAGCVMKHKILNVWNDCFVMNEKMMPVKCSVLTPEAVLKSPVGNDVFLSTPIGPTGQVNAFLRPDNAVGIFVNFKRLLEFNAGKLPFAAAQIGNVYRNEVAPSFDLHCSYEFVTADFVHFCDPSRMDHVRFKDVRETVLCIRDHESQRSVAIEDLVKMVSIFRSF